MVGKRTGQGASAKARVVDCCASCHSLFLKTVDIAGKQTKVCQRCGHVSLDAAKLSLDDARQLHRSRKHHVRLHYEQRRDLRHRSFATFVERFHLRACFKIISIILIGAGVVLLSTSEWGRGLVFVFIGIMGLYVGLQWL